MPFPFTLPTTSHLNFTTFLSSKTHPSLPTAATNHRNAVRNALKAHKQLPPTAKASDLVSVLSALTAYISYISRLDQAFYSGNTGPQDVYVRATAPMVAEWRPTLSSSAPGLALPRRARIQDLRSDLLFALLALGQTYCMLARASVEALHAAHTSKTPPTAEQRTTAIAAAMKYYLQAQSVFAHAASRPPAALPDQLQTGAVKAALVPADILSSTFSALSSLTLSEATLLSTAAQDPYPLLASTSANPNDREWMIAAPTIPKVRAHLFARLCVAAADHAQHSLSTLGPSGAASTTLDPDLSKYCSALAKTCRARAARFLGVDADAQGRTGEALGYLKGAMPLLSDSSDASPSASTLSRLKGSWSAARASRKEDKRLARGGEWGADAYRLEELRVCELLHAKWEKSNDTVGVQLVEEPGALMASLPTGREWHTPEPWTPPPISDGVLSSLRAPAQQAVRHDGDDAASSDDDEDDAMTVVDVPGAWAGDAASDERVDSRAAYY